MQKQNESLLRSSRDENFKSRLNKSEAAYYFLSFPGETTYRIR